MSEENLRKEIGFALGNLNPIQIYNILQEEVYKKEERDWKAYVMKNAFINSKGELEVLEPRDKTIIKGSGITKQIISKLSIIDIAKRYGLDVDPRGMCECPFHNDTNPSLKFYDNQGRFHCFGCNVDGNIIDFIYLLRKSGIKCLKKK